MTLKYLIENTKNECFICVFKICLICTCLQYIVGSCYMCITHLTSFQIFFSSPSSSFSTLFLFPFAKKSPYFLWSSFILSLFIPYTSHIIETMLYLCLCVWFISINMMVLRCILICFKFNSLLSSMMKYYIILPCPIRYVHSTQFHLIFVLKCKASDADNSNVRKQSFKVLFAIKNIKVLKNFS